MADNKIGLQAVWDNSDFNRGQKEYIEGLAKASGATVSTTKAMGDGKGSGLSGAAIAVGTALGNLAAGAIRSAINSLSNMSSAVIENLGSLQKLEIGLTMLEAREMTQAGISNNISDAMAGATERASAMLEVLKDVSLESPFEYQDIARVLQLNMAFGQSSKMAMALTQAMTDMAAVSPMASPELLERIAYNFSQMSLTGKITARDVRDLALAGVNLGQILREELGGGMDYVNEKLKSGEITMRDVSQAFIDYAERNFAGAARSMATKTIPGLISSFKDLAAFASKDLFGPAGEVVTQFLEKVYYAAKNLLDSGVLQKIGIWLKVLAETATNFLSKFFGLSDIVAQEASSTATALNTAITDTVDETLEAATEEAKKVIPTFSAIGLDTAVAWLEGFSSADFSMLGSIQGYLSTLSSNLASQLGLEGYEAQQMFADMFANITQSIAGGNTAEAFNIIIDKFGAAGSKVVQLAQANMQLAQAEDEVTNAQKRLTAAQKQEESSLSKIDKLTWEYNDALRKGASEESLKAKLAQVNAAYDEHDAAVKAVDAAEDQVDIAKEQRDAAREQADAIKDLVDTLMQFATAQQTAFESTKKAIEELEDEYEQLAEITPEDIFAPSIDQAFDTQKLQEYEDEVEKHFSKIKEWLDKIPPLSKIFAPPERYDSWKSWWQEKGLVGGILDLSIGKLFNPPGEYSSWADWWNDQWEGTGDMEGDKFGQEGLKDKFSKMFDWIRVNWDKLWGDEDEEGAVSIMKRHNAAGMKAVQDAWSDGGFWGLIKEGIRLNIISIAESLKRQCLDQNTGMMGALGIVFTEINNRFWNWFYDIFVAPIVKGVNEVKNSLQPLIDNLNDFKDNSLQWFIDKVERVREVLFGLRDNLKAIRDWIMELGGKISYFVSNPLASLSGAMDWLRGLFGIGGSSGSAQGRSSSGISGSAQGASIIPSSYTTTSTVNTVSNVGGATVINLTVGDINNGMDLNSLTQLIKKVTGGSLVYG